MALLYLRTTSLITEATLEHRDHGRKKMQKGGRRVTLCLFPTMLCIPSHTVKSPRIITKYDNSDSDFPRQVEHFLKHSKCSAKLTFFMI